MSDNFREAGIIRPYSAAYSPGHRAEVMALFKAGIVRILVCTDAAGMVRNANVDIVVQWKLPASVSTFVQRAGRAGRGEGRSGIAVPKANKQYGIEHGLLRGAYGGGPCDDNNLKVDVRLDHSSPDEGLYTLVQTGGCRRRVLTAVY
jgi:superfamily II DNA helicase RecQ